MCTSKTGNSYLQVNFPKLIPTLNLGYPLAFVELDCHFTSSQEKMSSYKPTFISHFTKKDLDRLFIGYVIRKIKKVLLNCYLISMFIL